MTRAPVILFALALYGCGSPTQEPDPVRLNSYETADLSAAGEAVIPTTAYEAPKPVIPSHYYDERDGVLYSYIAAVSDEDRKTGKAAGDVITFAYLGEEEGRHTLVQVRPDGSIASRATCKKPCRVITRADGSQVGYNEGSIIGAAFADALSGKLERAHYVPRQAPAAPVAPPPAPTLPPIQQAAWSHFEQGLIDNWMELNSACRGGSDPTQVEIDCAMRDGPASMELAKQNICYGREGEYGAQHVMHRCGPGSYRLN